jgi:hypothetical protein
MKIENTKYRARNLNYGTDFCPVWCYQPGLKVPQPERSAATTRLTFSPGL